MSRYKILESVRSGVERVDTYEDLEIHHPSRNRKGLATGREEDFEPRRHHERIDGEFEEVRLLEAGRRLVKKDFILQQDVAGPVMIPAPVRGYIHYRKDGEATVAIYDRPHGSDGAKLLGQVLHMDPRSFSLKEGDHVAYGQPLGRMSDAGTPGAVHAHVELDSGDFRRYIADITNGVIRPESGQSKMKSGIEAMEEVSRQPSIRVNPASGLQHTLNTLGYRDATGHALIVDDDFGPRTREAVQAFQRACGLPDDGVVGRHTRAALAAATGAPLLSDATHPDHALYRQALAGIKRLEQGGFAGDMARRNAAGMLVFEAKVAGLHRIDHVVANVQGTGLFAVEGGLHDPAHRRVYVDRGQAADRTVAQASEQLRTDALAMRRMQPRLDPRVEAHQPAPDVRIHAPHTDRRPSF